MVWLLARLRRPQHYRAGEVDLRGSRAVSFFIMVGQTVEVQLEPHYSPKATAYTSTMGTPGGRMAMADQGCSDSILPWRSVGERCFVQLRRGIESHRLLAGGRAGGDRRFFGST